MSNWNTNFYIGDRVHVTVAHTTRDPRTHRIVVKHSESAGTIDSIDLNGEDIGVRFEDGHVQEVHNWNVHKVEEETACLT
jgi:hypothetical protein